MQVSDGRSGVGMGPKTGREAADRSQNDTPANHVRWARWSLSGPELGGQSFQTTYFSGECEVASSAAGAWTSRQWMRTTQALPPLTAIGFRL